MGRLFRAVVFLWCVGASSLVSANVVITGTRVVYKADDKEVTIKLTNAGIQPALVQAWADKGNAKSTPETADAPFLIMPPIFRMEPDKSQTLRMTYTGETLPPDRESLFWLNVLDVPPMPVKAQSTQQNYLQIAIRSRIKIFFRPAGLSGTADEAADHIKWSIVNSTAAKTYRLRASNPAAFHVSFGRVALTVAGHKYEAEASMIAPGKMADFKLKGLAIIPSGKVTIRYETLNDFGGLVPHVAELLV